MQRTPPRRFGPFIVDPQEHRLLRDGRPVPVTRKSFALLGALIDRAGSLVTKAELFEQVWAGSVVTDAALSRCIRELRIALGDDAAAPRYIATAHGLGFRFVAPVVIVAEARAQAEAEGLADPAGTLEQRLVGRGAEMAVLDSALDAACAGLRQTVFVTGEAGIGKTALVERFIERHAGSGTLWAGQGRCIEQYGTSEAYLPIHEALERLAAQAGAGRLRDVLARYAPAWLAQLPWLAHDADPALLQRAVADANAQRMLRELAQALEVLAADKPVVVWLEDLHWSDPSSLAVVSFLAGRRDPARLLLICSFRPAEAQLADSPLQSLVLRVGQRGRAQELPVGLLDSAAVGEYLRLRFGDSPRLPAQRLGAFIHRRTEGNALFTVAMVDDLVRDRTLRPEGSAWVLDVDVAELGDRLPDNLRRFVHAQVERLDEGDRRLVEAAAVAGSEFSAAAVAAALQAEVTDVEDACARLVEQRRFLRACAPVTWPDLVVAAGFGFVHALYWQGIYERVPESRRAEWQRRIGRRQEQAFGDSCAPIAAELAMRFEAAHDAGRSLRYLQIAGANALARCAYPEAIELLRRGLKLLPGLPPEAQPRQELDLLLPLGAALMAAQGYASPDVEATYQRALALCADCGRAGELERVLRGQWNVAFLRADLQQARKVAEKLLRRADESNDAGLAFDAHTKLGQTWLHLGGFAEARSHLEHALALPDAEIEGAGDDDSSRSRALPRVAAYLAWVQWFTGHPAQALRHADDALAFARAAASPHSTAFALGFISWLHAFRGDMARALELARQQQALSAEHGLMYWRVWAEFTQGMGRVHGGDRDAGVGDMRRALKAMRAAGAQVGIPHFLCLLAEAELASGHLGEAGLTLVEANDLIAGNGNAFNAADAARLQGELALAECSGRPAGQERAEQCFKTAMALARAQGATCLELRAATSLARLWLDQGHAARAFDLLAPVRAGFGSECETHDSQRADELLGRLRRRSPALALPMAAEPPVLLTRGRYD